METHMLNISTELLVPRYISRTMSSGGIEKWSGYVQYCDHENHEFHESLYWFYHDLCKIQR